MTVPAPDSMTHEEIRAILSLQEGCRIPRDVRVLLLNLGLCDGRKYSFEEIGVAWGVTRERVRQLRDRALRRLRESGVCKLKALAP